MITARSLFIYVFLSFFLVACGSSSQTSSSQTTETGISADRLDFRKLSAPITGLSAYQVVQQYKPNWLQKRGPSSINNPVPIKVYLDGTGSAYGSVESLGRIDAINVAYVQHFNAQEAQYRFGLGNVAGALLVRTKPVDE